MGRSVSIRLGTEGKAQIKADMEEIAGSGDATAKRWARSFDRAGDDVEAAMRRQASAAEKLAAILPQTAVQMRVNDANGTGFGQWEGSARQSASAFRELLDIEDKLDARAQALIATLNPAAAAQDRYNAEVREAAELMDRQRISLDQFLEVEARASAALAKSKPVDRAEAITATPMQQRLDREAGTGFNGGAGSARESADAFRELLAQQERMEARTRSLISAIDPAYAAQQRFNLGMREAKELLEAGSLSADRYAQVERALASELEESTRARDGATQSLGAQKAGYQQLSYQIGDIASQATSISSFGDAVRVVSQQASQFMGAIGLIVGDGTGEGGKGGAAGVSDAIGDMSETLGGANDAFDAATGASERLTTMMGAGTAAAETNTTATGGNTASRTVQTSATAGATIATEANSVATGANTAATEANAVATTGLAGTKARLLSLMLGPWGAVIIGGVTILGMLASKYMEASDGADKTTDATQAQLGSVEALDAANKVLAETLGQLVKTQGQVRAEAIGAANANLAAAEAARTRAIEEINLAKAMLAQTQARSRTAGDRGDLAAMRVPADMKAIEKQETDLLKLEDKIMSTRRNRDRLIVESNRLQAVETADRIDGEAKTLAAAGKTGAAERALADIRKTGREQLAKGAITEEQYRSRVVAGEKALDAAREADRKHSNARQQGLARDAASMEVNAQASLDLARAYLAGGDAAMRAEAARKGLTDATKKGIDGDAQTQRQLAVMVGEQIANSAKSLSQMREETDARAALNAQVLAGTLPTAQMNQGLAEETALRPLLKLQTLAQGEALQVLTKVIDEYRAAFARKNAVEAEGTAIAAIDATKRRVAEIKASILDMSLSPEQAAIAAARRQAEAEAKTGRFSPDRTRDLVEQRVAEATAQARANQARYIIDTLRGQEDALVLGQRELQLVAANDNVRSAELEKLKIMLDIRRRFPEMAEQDVQAILDGVDAQAALKAELDRTTRAMDELRGFGVDFVDTVLSEDTWSSWGSAGKTILNMLRTEFIKLALLNPLKNLINGNSDAPTLGGVLGGLSKIIRGGARASSSVDLLTGGASIPGVSAAETGIFRGLASGTQHWSGGRALVGEMGPEIAELPFGARVIPAGETRRMLAGNDNGQRGDTHVHIHANDAVLAETVRGWVAEGIGIASARGAAGGAAMSEAEGDARAQRKLGRW